MSGVILGKGQSTSIDSWIRLRRVFGSRGEVFGEPSAFGGWGG